MEEKFLNFTQDELGGIQILAARLFAAKERYAAECEAAGDDECGFALESGIEIATIQEELADILISAFLRGVVVVPPDVCTAMITNVLEEVQALRAVIATIIGPEREQSPSGTTQEEERCKK